MGRYTRQSPEDPKMQIFDVRQRLHTPGGSLLAAAMFRSLNHKELVYVQALLTKTQYQELVAAKLLTDRGSILIDENECILKERIWDEESKRVLARFDTRHAFTSKRVLQFQRKFGGQKKRYKAVIVSDYQKGTIDAVTIDYLKRYDCPFFVDTKNPDLSVWKDLPNCYVKVNLEENNRARNHEALEHIIVTAGADGAYHNHNGRMTHYPTFPFDGKKPNTIGAGDVFLAAFAGQMLATNDIAESIRYANIASRAALRRYAQHLVSKTSINNEIESVRELVA